MMDVVADENDGQPAYARLHNQFQNGCGLVDAKRGRRLVENKNPGAKVEGAGDGHRLAFAPRQCTDGLGRVADVDADVGHRIARNGIGTFLIDTGQWKSAAGGLAAEKEIAGYAHQRDHAEVLEHGCYAPVLRVARTAKHHWPAVNQDFALGRLVDAGEDFNQRRLAGAVVSKEAVDFARINLDVDVLQCTNATEGDTHTTQLHCRIGAHLSAPRPSAFTLM